MVFSVRRTYKRKTTNKSLSNELLERARALVQQGMSNRAIAADLGFNESTIRRGLKKAPSGHLGRYRSVLSTEQELEIVEHCKALDKRFYGLSLRSLRHLLYQYAEENKIKHPSNKESKLAGRDFTRSFMKRHRLSLRTPRKISVARTMGFNRVQLENYMQLLGEVYEKYKFPPNKVIQFLIRYHIHYMEINQPQWLSGNTYLEVRGSSPASCRI